MNKRFRKGMAILVTLTFLMQSVIFTSPAMFSVYAEADQSAVESVIDTDDGMQDATDTTDSETELEEGQPAGEQEGLQEEEESPGDTVEEPADIEEPAGEKSEEPAEEESEDPVEEVQEEPAPAAEPEEVVKRDAESPAKAPTKAANDDGLTVLAFTSDIHNQDDNIARNRLHTWLGNVADIYGPVDVMSFCGDMGAARANESQFWQYTDAIMDLVDEDVPASVYTTGNHEFYNGNYGSSSDSLAVQNKYIIGDVGLEGDNYIIYCLGSDNWNNYQDNYTQAQIDALTSFLNDSRLDNDTRPIIILTHFPLHWYGSRSGTTRAINVIEALNAASQAGRKIILLWGHNHSVSDENYDQIFQPGDTIEYAKTSGSTATIEFLYAAAGCMSDYEYNGGHSDLVKGKGLVITINDQNQVTMAFHNEAGTDVTEGGAYTEGDPVEATGMSLTPETMSITAGDSGNLTLSFTPANATDKKVTWTSSDTSVATVSGGVVTGVAPGTATITATHVNGGFTDTCTVTVKKAPGSGVTPENGKKYVILAGDEYALTSEGDEVGYSNGSGDQIFHYYGLTGEAFTVGETVTPDHLLWTFETSEDGTGYYIKANTGEYLNGTYADNDEGGSTGTLKLDETKDVWVITGMTAEGAPAGAHILKSTNASATASSDKYLTHGNGDNGGDNTNIFTLRSGDNATAVIFYEYNDDGTAVEDPDDPDDPPVDPPTPTDGAVYKLVDQFTSGSDYLIVSRNDAGSGYALTNPGGTSGGASMASTAVTVQNGDIDGDGTADMYISTDATDVVWKATANGERFDITNGSDYLEGKSGKVSVFDSQQYADRGWTYTSHQLKHAGGNNTYVVYCDGDAFTATYDSTSNEVYIYEKTETVQGEDPVESVELNKESLSLVEGDSATLTATVKPATAADKSVTWTSSDDAVATVDEHGKVTAVAEGTATITVTTTDGGKTATCEVTVEAAPEPTGDLYKEVSSFEDGREYILGVTKDDGSVYVLSYESGDYASSDTLAVTAASGEEPASIITDKESVVWTYEGEHQYLAIAGKYFYPSSGNSIRVYRNGRAITYADGAISFETSSSGTQYVTCENGTFGTSAEAEEAAAIRLFVKSDGTEPPVVTYTFGGFTWTGSDEEGYTAAVANYIGSDGTQKTVDAAVTTETTEATCTEDGATVYTATVAEADSLDGEARTDAKSVAIPAAGHEWGAWTVSKEATETEEGEESQTCAVCGETQTRPIPKLTHTHHLTKVDAKAAACEEDGNIEYWVCSEGSNPCGKYFADEEGLEEISLADTVIPAIGHDWGEPVYGWADDNSTVMAVRTCLRDPKHLEAETATVTSAVTKPATCEEKGETTYTSAAFENPAFAVQTKTVANIDALGHEWGTPTYEWAADHSTVTAKRVCANDPEHVQTEVAVATSLTWSATCEAAGKTVYIANFKNLAFEQQSAEVVIPAIGHAWGEWTVFKEATCTEAGIRYRVCSNCLDKDFEIVPATGHDMSFVEAKAATCEEDGNVEYYVCGNCGKFFRDEAGTEELEQVVIPALGHDWSKPVYGWAADNSTVTATRICANDPKHIETETAAVTSKVTKKATCEQKGETTYTTAAFKNPAFTVQTKTIANIDATGHDMVLTSFTAPTATKTGSIIYTCSKCGATEKVVVPRTQLAKPVISIEGTVSDRSFEVSWEKIDGATNYQVAYRKAGATKWTTIWAGNKTSCTISDLTKKGAYQIKVRAYRKSDDTYSSYSAVKYRYMMNGTSVKLTSTAAGKLKVTYAKDASASGYKIVYSTSSKMTNTKTITVKGADKVTRTITGLKSGKTYYVYVRPYKVIDGKTYLGVRSPVKSYKVK